MHLVIQHRVSLHLVVQHLVSGYSTRTRAPLRIQPFVLVAFLVLSGGATQAAGPDRATDIKVLASPGALAARPGIEPWHDYGAFALYRLSEETWRSLTLGERSRVHRVDDMDRLHLGARPFNSQRESPTFPAELRFDDLRGDALQVVQFVGPIRPEWLAALRGVGAVPVHAVARNGYLVWVGDAGRARLADFAGAREFLQLSIPYHPFFKIGTVLRDRLEARGEVDLDAAVPVVVQMYRHPREAASANRLLELALQSDGQWSDILRYRNRHLTVRLGDVVEIAHLPEVTWIGERLPRQLDDEVQGQILVASFDAGLAGPDGPGYLAFLQGLGFSEEPDDYPVVDIVDDGIGNGTTASGDPTFHVDGSLAEPSRLAYVANCTASADGGGPDGHGHLNLSVAGGYDTRDGFPFQDLDGFQRGLGINPWGRFAGTRIFAPLFDLSACGGSDTGLIQSIQNNGAQIANNSWGCAGCGGSYDDSSQAFDVGVRDADLDEPGNQELIFIFSAGNSGPSAATLGTPGNGKNMITVGAAESDRPGDEDGPWTDGCGIAPSGADNAMDVIPFSSRGPAPGERAKPELIAPGTHVYGTASTHASYNGTGICDGTRPSGQAVFAASSGTSHSAPAVSGLASLLYWWLENGRGGDREDGSSFAATPSPALTKAYLIAHPTYLTGESAGDDLPSPSQGYGMPDMATLFDATPRVVIDQTAVFDATGETWSWTGSVADPSKPVRIVMAYTDEAGMIGTSPQVNDLDLTASVAGTAYLGNVMSGAWSVPGGSPDPLNTSEAIFVQAGPADVVTVTVTAANIAGDGVPGHGDSTDQDFALVCYNCRVEPTFDLDPTPSDLAVCAPDSATYEVEVGSILSFAEPVTLELDGAPLGSSIQIQTNPVMPPGTTQVEVLETAGVSPGSYEMQLSGTAGTTVRSRPLGLHVADTLPGAPSLAFPTNLAVDVAIFPSFEWAPSSQAHRYVLEIATDAAFTDLVETAEVSETQYTPSVALDPLRLYFWRVRAINGCGAGVESAVSSFTTMSPCLLVDDDDNGPDMRALYEDGLLARGLRCDLWDTGNSDLEPDAATLGTYGMVLWFTGDEFGGAAGPGAAGESALASYLDGGGCFVLSSQDYHFDRELTPFMQTYLGISSITDDASYATVEGGGFFSGLGPYTLSFPFTNFADAVTPDATAQLAFLDTSAPAVPGAAVSKVTTAYRTAFLGFPLATLPSEEDRAAVLEALVGFCRQVIFADGFESGGAGGWSLRVP